MRPELLGRSLALWFPEWARPSEDTLSRRKSRSTALRMTGQKNREYYVCRCGGWVFADKVRKGAVTHCQQCWKPWPKTPQNNKQQGQQSSWKNRQSSGQQQQPQSQQTTSPRPPRSRPRRVKGMEVWKENWDSLPEAVQKELRRQGVDPHAQKEEEEEPLLKLLQEHKHSLPVSVQLELEKCEPPAPTALEQGEACSKKLSQATGRLKGLVKKQLGLQESINETKEALRLLLGDMQSTMAAIAESQREVEEAKELSAVVVEPGPPAPGPADMETDELLGHIAVELTADQQAALKEKIAESKKRKLGPPPSLPASQGDLEAVGNPPGLVATGGLGAQGANSGEKDKDAPRPRSRSPKSTPVPPGGKLDDGL